MNHVRELRKKRGWTLADLAEKIGITVPHLSRMERSQRPLTEDWLRRLSAALGCEPGDLLSETMGSPLAGEFIEDPDELALVLWWRTLGDDQRELVTGMMHPPTVTKVRRRG